MLKIKKNIGISYLSEEQLSCSPKLILLDTMLYLTSSTSHEEFQHELSNLKGSVDDWLGLKGIDCIGFNTKTNLLQLLSLKLAEKNKVPENFSQLKNAKQITAIPIIQLPLTDFEILPFEYRYYSIENNLLICFNHGFSENTFITEIQISNDFSLIFENDYYCAWVLYNPEIHLCSRLDQKNNNISNQFLKSCLKQSLDLIQLETITQIENKDQNLLHKIAELYHIVNQSIQSESDISQLILSEWLYDIVDKFYDSKDIKAYFLKSK